MSATAFAKESIIATDLPWLNDLRQRALARFNVLGLPTVRHEEWKYTSLSAFSQLSFSHPSSPALDVSTLKGFLADSRHRIVFVNGRFDTTLSALKSLPKGIRLESLAQTLKRDPESVRPHFAQYAQFEDQAFTALNTALAGDGVFAHVASDVVLDEPIHLIFVSSGDTGASSTNIRNLIIAEKNSRSCFIETYLGLDSGVRFNNIVTELTAKTGATVEHYKLQQEGSETYHVENLALHQGGNSKVSSHLISLGGRLVRNETQATLSEEGSDCTLNGLYAVRGEQHVDNRTVIDHAKPGCTSHELYKGILDESARGIFNGRIIVREGAQKTDAQQTNRNLLLSQNATANSKPQLEIYADDVKCSHGATVSQVDEQALFYLRSRGIGLEQARGLMAYAFMSDIVNRIKLPAVQTELSRMLFAWIPKGYELEGLL